MLLLIYCFYGKSVYIVYILFILFVYIVCLYCHILFIWVIKNNVSSRFFIRVRRLLRTYFDCRLPDVKLGPNKKALTHCWQHKTLNLQYQNHCIRIDSSRKHPGWVRGVNAFFLANF